MKYNINDFIGKKFNRLTILKETRKQDSNRRFVKCKCECGKIKIIDFLSIISNGCKSCGCLNKERHIERINKYIRTHGESKTRFYKIWKGIRNRCYNKNNAAFNKYGGRGIKCSWNKYEDFKKDMYKGYMDHVRIYGESDTSIDRKDNNGDYNKENCRWATARVQSLNRNNNKIIEFNNQKLTLKEWSEKTGISFRNLQNRLRYGWSIERMLTTPVKIINA